MSSGAGGGEAIPASGSFDGGENVSNSDNASDGEAEAAAAGRAQATAEEPSAESHDGESWESR